MLVSVFLTLCLFIGSVVSSMCRPGWNYFNGSCYGTANNPVPWGSAQAVCMGYGGYLASAETKAENDFLKNLAGKMAIPWVWLGGTDFFHDGIWEWIGTGASIYPMSDWMSGEPNGAAGEDCLVLYKGLGWYDAGCHNTASFICEARPLKQDRVDERDVISDNTADVGYIGEA